LRQSLEIDSRARKARTGATVRPEHVPARARTLMSVEHDGAPYLALQAGANRSLNHRRLRSVSLPAGLGIVRQFGIPVGNAHYRQGGNQLFTHMFWEGEKPCAT
jgi:hypothetical protein